MDQATDVSPKPAKVRAEENTARNRCLTFEVYTVQRAGGWKTQVMVQRHAHLSPDHIKAAVE